MKLRNNWFIDYHPNLKKSEKIPWALINNIIQVYKKFHQDWMSGSRDKILDAIFLLWNLLQVSKIYFPTTTYPITMKFFYLCNIIY
jgi:hypothetical protein